MKYLHSHALLSFISFSPLCSPPRYRPESGIYVFPQAAIAQYSNVSDLELIL